MAASEKASAIVVGEPGTIEPGDGAEVTSRGWAEAAAGPAQNAPSTTATASKRRRTTSTRV
jgi:hypothetical protein